MFRNLRGSSLKESERLQFMREVPCMCHGFPRIKGAGPPREEEIAKAALVAPCTIKIASNGDVWFSTNIPAIIYRYVPSTGEFFEGQATRWSIPVGIDIDEQNRKVWFISLLKPILGWVDMDTMEVVERTIPGPQGLVRLPLGGTSLTVDKETRLIWFTTFEQQLGIYDPNTDSFFMWNIKAGTEKIDVTDPIPPFPRDLISTSDSIYFTESGGNRVTRFIKSTEEFIRFKSPLRTSSPIGLSRDSENSDILWVTLANADAITTFNIRTEQFGEVLKTDTNGERPSRIDNVFGEAWFTLITGHKLVQVFKNDGHMNFFSTPTPLSAPEGVAIAPDGKIWINEWAADKIASFDPRNSSWNEIRIPGSPLFTYAKQIVEDAVGFMQENRDAFIKSWSRSLSVGDGNLLCKTQVKTAIMLYDAFINAFKTFVDTGDEKEMIRTLELNLPFRPNVTLPDSLNNYPGFGEWILLLNHIISTIILFTPGSIINGLQAIICNWILKRLD